MTITGVIVEYNPFHNGHLYHLQESIKQTGADVTIAVMSGDFLQRGEPALVSKWIRTKLALKSGIDLVVELPYTFSTQKAEIFARGAIAILNDLKATHICFGSESGKIQDFIHTVQFFNEPSHQKKYNDIIRQHLSTGLSYPKAASNTFNQMKEHDMIDLSKPNNILGYHYIKAIYDLNSAIIPETMTRTSSQYHDERMETGRISSATSIRKTLFSDPSNLTAIQKAVPEITTHLLVEWSKNYKFGEWESFFPYLKYRILTSTPEELGNIYEAEEGLEYRVKKYIGEANSFHDFMLLLKTKRYTWTRLQRYCTHILTNTKKAEMANAEGVEHTKYIRLLGMNEKGQKYLNKIKKDIPVPFITKISAHQHDLLNIDLNAVECYDSITTGNTKLEYRQPPIRFNEKSEDFI